MSPPQLWILITQNSPSHNTPRASTLEHTPSLGQLGSFSVVVVVVIVVDNNGVIVVVIVAVEFVAFYLQIWTFLL